MSEQKQSRHIGRKIWYTVVIVLSVIVLFVSAVGVIGTWFVNRTVTDVTVSLLGAANNAAGELQQVVQRLDQGAAEIKQITTNVSDVSTEVSQNVNDQGLIKTLLPAEQEQKLADLATTVQSTVDTIKSVLTAGISAYRAINQLPFINLPTVTEEQATNLETSAANLQASIAEMQKNVQDFRSGAADKISVVTQAANQATKGIDNFQSKLTKLDEVLKSIQAQAVRLQQVLPTVFIIIALFVTLFLIFVIYTQIEIILLFIRRWRKLGGSPALPEATAVAQPVTTEPKESTEG